MKRPSLLASLAAAALLASPVPASAGEVSPVQAARRPFGIQPIAPVQISGSDDRAADFNANALPYFRNLVDTKLGESNDFTEREGFVLDPSRLFLRTASEYPIRVYFIHEGAGYHNCLGLSRALAGEEEMGEPGLIFPDASFKGPNSQHRDAQDPLVVGDFVELDHGAPGQRLDFFCIPYKPWDDSYVATWFNNRALNPDGLQHVVAFVMPDSPYVMIGFEDLWGGGDLDYNDCLFVIDIGEVNAENLFDESTLPN